MPSSNKFFQMGEVGEHWLELGERDKARALFADGLKLVETLADSSSGPTREAC